MSEYRSLAERIDVSRLRWFERKLLEHADPLNLFLHLIGLIIIVYGLWINVIWWVIIGILFPIAGHLYVQSSNRKMKQKKGKKAALELSIGTIVIIVIAVTMLILGLVLVRTIMCGSMGLTEEAIGRAQGEIEKLFRETGGEVQCVGGSGKPVIMVPGEINVVHCTIRATQAAKYSISLTDSQFNGKPIPRNWIVTEKWSGEVPAGDTAVKVIRLQIPRDASEGPLIINLRATRDNNVVSPPSLDFEVKRVGWATSTMC